MSDTSTRPGDTEIPGSDEEQLLPNAPKFHDPAPPEEEVIDSQVSKPFLEHLEDLRWVFIRCITAISIGMVFAFIGIKQILEFLKWPLIRAVQNPEKYLTSLDITDSVKIPFIISFYTGLILALPFVLYFIADYLIPALTRKERKYLMPAFIGSTVLFLGGVAFCYFLLLPAALSFAEKLNAYLGINSQWTIQSYMSFTTHFMLATGAIFQMPLIIFVLLKLEVITSTILRKYRPHMIVGNVILTAVLTPDPMTQVMMAIPLAIMYEICIWIGKFQERTKSGEAQA